MLVSKTLLDALTSDVGRSDVWNILQLLAFVLMASQLLVSLRRYLHQISFPSHGLSLHSRSWANTKFLMNAIGVISHGYSKSREKAFQILRSDNNVIILPPSHVNELSSIPHEIADGTMALEHDLLGQYTGLRFILESRLHHRVVQRKLTPNLGKLTPLLEDEIGKAIDDYFSHIDKSWIEVKLYPLLLSLTARVSARAFVGTSFCRDQRWLDITINFVEDMFRTVVILRTFPTWLRPVICHLIPSYWRGKGYFKHARELLGPYIQQRLTTAAEGQKLEERFLEDSSLNWLFEISDAEERNVERLAHTETVLSLAGIHTMLLRQLSVIYDLIEHPEYLPILLDEIGSLAQSWDKSSYSALQKMDSFIRESQRLAPPTTLGLKRIMKQPYTFEDGTFIPRGAYVCVAAYAIENDPRFILEPEKFNGMRSFAAHMDDKQSKHAFTTTETTVLGFGHGKTACPGRFFASLVIKMAVVKLITEFEFTFPPGKKRPSNWVAHEFLFASPWDKIRMRRREKSLCPF